MSGTPWWVWVAGGLGAWLLAVAWALALLRVGAWLDEARRAAWERRRESERVLAAYTRRWEARQAARRGAGE